jgi:hypothetical protein
MSVCTDTTMTTTTATTATTITSMHTANADAQFISMRSSSVAW